MAPSWFERRRPAEVPKVRFASRFVLPSDVIVGIIAIMFGLSGGVGTGQLRVAVDANVGTFLWMLCLCGVGMLKVCVSGTELMFGRHWTDSAIFFAASVRCAVSFVAFPIWIYINYFIWMMALHSDKFIFGQSIPIFVLAPTAALYSAWIFTVNLKLRYILNPDVPTEALKVREMLARTDIQ